MYEKRFTEIAARKLEIRAMLEGNEQVDMDKITKELQDLEAEEKQLRARIQKIEELRGGTPGAVPPAGTVPGTTPPAGEFRSVETFGQLPENRDAKTKEEAEKRGKALKENRSVTIGSSSVISPRPQATDIRPYFNQVSSLIDLVTTRTLQGGESFRQPYLTGWGTGDYKTESTDYADSDVTFDYAEMLKAKVTAYSEDSEEVLKLPSADYDGEVTRGITIALRKKMTREILVGTGATNHLAGIFSAAATAIDAATDIELIAIDETTLDDIIYSYGGDENVEDVAVLVLNKKDLKAFAKLRDADGQRIYKVVANGNTGTIDGIPYVINSACKAVTDVSTNAGEYAMAYGPLSNYMVTLFADIDIQRSTDYKFKQGMIAHRGSVFAGGNVVSKNGFLRVKKG